LTPLNGELWPAAAAETSALPAAAIAPSIGATSEAVSIEPPEIAPDGKLLSPITTSTRSMAMPSVWATICAITV